ncbi:hypothetical protein PUNSTDRAFT_97523 [Punctularia strigosozonata HHB-11173 SS5]|uniref:uncharacterized protein n=1 Tax=Punctularia strigosozonata (strain HHB-11173) TaxID=741275 RepID=UPI0004417D5F|nr:uncharacterized protein PUNSTDRAFT_97523 [Punctularia strigosozonata HHB-11173 SS5]EIN12704.1 hypothetical protein PUNSTDRAFT_97523 [Punctularia strigosozonata HHB-11173 SS5]
MKIVSTFHPPSSVIDCVKCKLTSAPDIEHLVVAKPDKLEVFSLQPEGLRLETSTEIWGRILRIRELPVQGERRSNLLVLTDHPDPKLIALELEDEGDTPRLVEIKTSSGTKSISLHDKNSRQAEFLTDVWVHPSGSVILVSCYAGRLTVVRVRDGVLQQEFPVSLQEINLLALCFLPSPVGDDEDPETEVISIGIVYLDHQSRVQLLARDLEAFELSVQPSPALPPTPLPISADDLSLNGTSLSLVPIPTTLADIDANFRGGVLVLGGRKVMLFELASEEHRKKWMKKNKQTMKQKKEERYKEKLREKEREREGRRRKARSTVEWPWSEITAWCPVTRTCRGLLIGDAYGRMSMLSIDPIRGNGLTLLPLGETSPPTSIAYLTSQVFYLGSHMGDSQLLRISPTPHSLIDKPTLPIDPRISTVLPSQLSSYNAGESVKGKGKRRADLDSDIDVDPDAQSGRKGKVVRSDGSYLEVLATYQNLAPVTDALLMNADGSGQPQIVTCSGGANAGSLKVVRKGADFKTAAVVESLPGTVSVWPVRKRYYDNTDSYIVASTLRCTQVLLLEEHDTVNPLVAASTDFATSGPTISVANILRRRLVNGKSEYEDSSLVVQVTPSKMRLLEHDMIGPVEFRLVDTWKPSGPGPQEIVTASINPTQIALGLRGGRLCVFRLAPNDHFDLRFTQHFSNDISAVSCLPLNPGNLISAFIAVGFWGSNNVMILCQKGNILELELQTDPLPALPRSLLLYNFGTSFGKKDPNYHAHLLIGLADGSLVSYAYARKELKDKKVVPLGASPVSLVPCEANGKKAIFCCGTRAAVVYWDRDRLQNAPALLKNVVTACPLNSTSFEQSTILVTGSGFTIGHFGNVAGLHVRSVPLGVDVPKRITYNNESHLLGVACIRKEPHRIGDDEGTIRSSFRLLDDTSFGELDRFDLEADEDITSAVVLSLGTAEAYTSHFCIGTADFTSDDQLEVSKGRLVVFDPSTKVLSPVATLDVNGCVYALASIQGLVAAAVNSAVIVYRLETDGPTFSSKRLVQLANWNHNYFVTNLVTRGSRIFVGDAISSVSILELTGQALQTVARDYGPLWPVAIESTGPDSVIGADGEFNLFTFKLSEGKLERDGSYHLGEQVNKFVPGGLLAADPAHTTQTTCKPIQTLFTSSGRIAIVIDVLDPEVSLHLTNLHRNMSKVITGLTGIQNETWRSPATSRGRTDAETSRGFLDGDFLEAFLDVPRTSPSLAEILEGENVAERLTLGYERYHQLLESVQALH